jgi:hypothetical protein
MSPICANDACDNLVERTGRVGRPRIYCSLECRPAPRPASTVTVTVAHDEIECGTRPAGRIWQVRLSRGKRTVTIADGLGRPSAEHLARQVDELISHRRDEGGLIG